MKEFKRYKEFLFNEEIKKPTYYRFLFNEIHIYVDDFIKTFKDDFNINCWYIYNNKNSVSLEYFNSSSDTSDENMNNLRKFMYEKTPYLRDFVIHKDDNRIVIRFVEPGDPIKFKFYH